MHQPPMGRPQSCPPDDSPITYTSPRRRSDESRKNMSAGQRRMRQSQETGARKMCRRLNAKETRGMWVTPSMGIDEGFFIGSDSVSQAARLYGWEKQKYRHTFLYLVPTDSHAMRRRERRLMNPEVKKPVYVSPPAVPAPQPPVPVTPVPQPSLLQRIMGWFR
ncbi:MAG: hypothetical protein RJB26_1325 [Pseudomonadota bacterium]|jgi:hypothetical protein